MVISTLPKPRPLAPPIQLSDSGSRHSGVRARESGLSGWGPILLTVSLMLLDVIQMILRAMSIQFSLL